MQMPVMINDDKLCSVVLKLYKVHVTQMAVLV